MDRASLKATPALLWARPVLAGFVSDGRRGHQPELRYVFGARKRLFGARRPPVQSWTRLKFSDSKRVSKIIDTEVTPFLWDTCLELFLCPRQCQ